MEKKNGSNNGCEGGFFFPILMESIRFCPPQLMELMDDGGRICVRRVVGGQESSSRHREVAILLDTM